MNAWRSIGVADQFGRRVVVTGANTGLGYQTSLALASAGADVVMAVRDLDRGQVAAQSIRQQIEDAKLRVIHLDLADLASVRDFAESEAATGPLDLLVNNAGLMLVPRRELTRDGFEMQMGVNHLGHFALTAGLLPALLQAPAGRVVSVTSIAARRSRSLDHGMGLVGAYSPIQDGSRRFSLTLHPHRVTSASSLRLLRRPRHGVRHAAALPLRREHPPHGVGDRAGR